MELNLTCCTLLLVATATQGRWDSQPLVCLVDGCECNLTAGDASEQALGAVAHLLAVLVHGLLDVGLTRLRIVEVVNSIIAEVLGVPVGSLLGAIETLAGKARN